MSILISGVDGFLGGKITRRLLEETNHNVIGLTMSMDFVDTMLKRENIERSERLAFITNEQFLSDGFLNDQISKSGEDSWKIQGAVHLAFSRRIQPAKDIASSITFASKIFHKLAECGTDHIINMSSQGVYGNTEEIRTEETPPAPENHYTMAKYASEVLFNDILRDCPHHTNFRLDLVAQSQNIIRGLCKSAKEGKINLKGGKQIFSFIDGEDAASAVVAMLGTDGDWNSVYNVGWNHKRYTLVELAELVAGAAESCGYTRPEIELKEADIALWAGMDSSRFMNKTGWKPEIDLQKTICAVLNSI